MGLRHISVKINVSEDYPHMIYETFEKRSERMLINFFHFLKRIAVVVRRNPLIKVVYFHNFSRFDGMYSITETYSYSWCGLQDHFCGTIGYTR